MTGFGFQLLASNFSPDGVTIPATGTYHISLNPSGPSTGTMTASLYIVPPDPVYSMNIGSTGTFLTTSRGQNAWVEFNGSAGQRISLQVRDVTFSGGFKMSLNKPDGTFFVAPMQASHNTFIDTITLPTTGVYKIFIDPYGYSYGETKIDLFDVPPDVVGSSLIDGAPITVSATVPGHNPTVTFDGLQGQQISVNITGATVSNGTQVRLKKPDGSVLAASSINSATGVVNSTNLPVAGTYAVEINPSGTNLGSATLALGGDVFGSIDPSSGSGTITTNKPGQSGWVSFNGTAGQRVSLKLTNVTFAWGSVSFRNPDGSLLGNVLQIGTSNNFLDTVTLPANGVYKILIDPASDFTGSVTMSLYNVPSDAAGTISISGGTQTRTTTVPGQNLFLSFAGAANQRVSLSITGVTIPGYTSVSVKDPNGIILKGGWASGGIVDDVVLPEAGTYGILVNPSDDNIGSITLQLFETGTGTGTPTVQIAHSVAVQKGLVTDLISEMSASLSVQKGFAGGVFNGEISNSVAVQFGSLQTQQIGTSVSVTTGPIIGSLSPVQATKGNSITLTVTGNNLTASSALRLYNSSGNVDAGITVTNINVNPEGTQLTATVQVNSSVVIGPRVLVITTNSFGTSQKGNEGVNVINIIQ